MPRIERVVNDSSSCEFYHTMELADKSIVNGQWDLRNGVREYLGNVDFRSKRVLEIGPASGFLSFHMESKGAAVTCIEPPLSYLWDFVPQPARILDPFRSTFLTHIEHIRNGFWYCHTKNKSAVRVYEESAYALPKDELGTFDVGLLAAILLHSSSPVKIIEEVAKRVVDTMIITELYFPDLEGQAVSRLAPSPNNPTCDTWWQFSTDFFVSFLGVLGFQAPTVSLHEQKIYDKKRPMFTVVAKR